MASVDQIAAWSAEELRVEIAKLVPKDHTFVEEESDGWFTVSVQTSESKVLWADRGILPKTVLTNAFGWLWMRQQKPKHPAWALRSPNQAHHDIPAVRRTPDPPDLDPEEIRKVYERESKKPKRK